MKVFAQTLDLKDDPELIEEYKRQHRAVWPEVIEALRGIGIRSMRIYLQGHRLFMYFEAPDSFDPARDYQQYARNPKAAAWDEAMRKFQVRAPGAPEGVWWAPMECVFDLERFA